MMADPDAALREALRPIVADWFDVGYENGRLDPDVLTDRVLSALAATASPGLDVERERLTREYNVAVANGLLVEARRIDRRLSALAADRETPA